MRTPRTPAEWGGAGGLQQSLHIAEYDQLVILRVFT